ncbi:MAG: hypothetical protein ACXVAO_07930 [Vulcanimicrobiaceae bacterium]
MQIALVSHAAILKWHTNGASLERSTTASSVSKGPKDDRRRFAHLLDALVGEDKAITACAARGTDGPSDERSKKSATWSPALVRRAGLWPGSCFDDLVELLHLSVEMTNDAWMAYTCSQLWHFRDALRDVCQPLLYDDLPAIAAIKADREMEITGLTIAYVCCMIQEAVCEPLQSYVETGAVALRQVAKHRLRDTPGWRAVHHAGSTGSKTKSRVTLFATGTMQIWQSRFSRRSGRWSATSVVLTSLAAFCGKTDILLPSTRTIALLRIFRVFRRDKEPVEMTEHHLDTVYFIDEDR